MNKYNDITFRNLKDKEKDYELLYKWCSQQFIYEWFEQRKLSYEEIKEKYKNKIKNKKQDLFIIVYKNVDIGLVQIYKHDNEIKLNELDKYKNIYEYDLFIGEEEYLSKGHGTNIVKIINDIIYKNYNADAIVLNAFRKNIRAINCYKKCNFKNIYNYIGKDTLDNEEEMVLLLNENN